MKLRCTVTRWLPMLPAALMVGALAGCSHLPGRPGPGPDVVRPDQVLDFDRLYAENCSGCHGAKGKRGGAVSLADPVYLALIDDATLRKITAHGVARTTMPAFARSAGGMLTDQQIDALVNGMRSRWARPDVLGGAKPPAYAAAAPGNPGHGAEVYQTFCASCHGPDGKGKGKLGSIVDGSYLALVSDQGLRTTVIAGVPDWGAPDWRRNLPGRPMTDQEISDVVAWLAAQRSGFPGQPYPSGWDLAHGGSQ